jgi:hypothetical protein
MKASRKRRQKRRKRKQKAAKTLQQRMRRHFRNQKVTIMEAQDGVKMSEVLEEFIAPYHLVAHTEDQYSKLLTMAVTAWNVALFPVQERKAHIEEVLEAVPEQVRADGRAIINELIERKDRYFSEYRRMIMDYEVTDTGDSYHLVVLSTPDEINLS